MNWKHLPSVAVLMAIGLFWGFGATATSAHAENIDQPPLSASPEVQLLLGQVSPALAREKWAVALAAANRARDVARTTNDSVGEALAQRSRAMALEGLGKTDESVAAWLEAATAWQRAGDGPGEVEAFAFAGILLAGENAEEAASLVERAIDLDDSGQHAFELGHGDFARDLFSAAVEIRERITPDSVLLAESLLGLGLAQGTKRNTLPDARKTMTRALAIAEAAAPRSELVARCLDARGGIEWSRGDVGAARDDHFRAFQILKEIDPGSYQLSTVLLRLGNTELVLGIDLAEEHSGCRDRGGLRGQPGRARAHVDQPGLGADRAPTLRRSSPALRARIGPARRTRP